MNQLEAETFTNFTDDFGAIDADVYAAAVAHAHAQMKVNPLFAQPMQPVFSDKFAVGDEIGNLFLAK